MNKLLKELWRGNLAPAETQSTTEEYQEKFRLLVEAEKRLRATLNTEQIALFEVFDKSHADLDFVSDEIVFSKGFKLAVQLLLVALAEE